MPCNLLVDKRKTSEEPCSERITSGGKNAKVDFNYSQGIPRGCDITLVSGPCFTDSTHPVVAVQMTSLPKSGFGLYNSLHSTEASVLKSSLLLTCSSPKGGGITLTVGTEPIYPSLDPPALTFA